MAGALRFLAFGSALGQGGGSSSGDGDAGSLQPVVRVLQEVGPVLQAVVETPGWYGHEGVAAAAAQVYRQAICSARKQGAAVREGRGVSRLGGAVPRPGVPWRAVHL